MTRKKKKKANVQADYGPAERQQHGEYVEEDTMAAGVRRLRNTTADPIAYYRKRGLITDRQFDAAERFSVVHRKASLTANYATACLTKAPGGETAMAETAERAKQEVRFTLKFVGYPLAGIIVHVAGFGFTAGSWESVSTARRPDQDGMIALRLALDGLMKYYQMGNAA